MQGAHTWDDRGREAEKAGGGGGGGGALTHALSYTLSDTHTRALSLSRLSLSDTHTRSRSLARSVSLYLGDVLLKRGGVWLDLQLGGLE